MKRAEWLIEPDFEDMTGGHFAVYAPDYTIFATVRLVLRSEGKCAVPEIVRCTNAFLESRIAQVLAIGKKEGCQDKVLRRLGFVWKNLRATPPRHKDALAIIDRAV